MLADLRQRRLTVLDLEQRLSLLERVLLLPAFVPPPAPQFIQQSGPIGRAITLYGSNFNVGSTAVYFGDIRAKIVGAPSATQIAALVPGGLTPAATAVRVKLTVSNDGGSAVSDENFTVQAAPAFTDPGSQFSPVHGTPGTQVTLNGFNFNAGGLQVQFAAVNATVIGTPTATQIAVQVPAGLVTGGGTSADVKITVTATVDGEVDSVVSDDTFRAELTVPAPTFAATGPQFILQSGSAGAQITLIGGNFNFPPVTVQFDSATATIVGSPSATQIAVLVPAGLTPPGTSKSVKISVTTAGGTVTSTQSFTVNG